MFHKSCVHFSEGIVGIMFKTKENMIYVPKSLVGLPIVINFSQFCVLHRTLQDRRNGSSVDKDSDADSDTCSDIGMEGTELVMVHTEEA